MVFSLNKEQIKSVKSINERCKISCTSLFPLHDQHVQYQQCLNDCETKNKNLFQFSNNSYVGILFALALLFLVLWYAQNY